MDNLTTAISLPNKLAEIEAIRKVCQKGTMRKIRLTKVDILLKSKTATVGWVSFSDWVK